MEKWIPVVQGMLWPITIFVLAGLLFRRPILEILSEIRGGAYC